MRQQYSTDFAITNSGGLRDNLTCPTADNADGLLPVEPLPVRGRALPDHARTGARGAAVREPVGDGQRQRRRAEGVPRDGRLAAAGDEHRPLRPVLRPVRPRTTSRLRPSSSTPRQRPARHGEPRHDGRPSGSRAACATSHRRARRARRRRPLHDHDQRLHDGGRRRLPGHPGPGAATQDLLDQDVADYIDRPGRPGLADDPGPGQVLRPEPGRGTNCVAGSC